MTYTCKKEALWYKDSRGKDLQMTEEQMINYINTSFGLKGTVTKLRLI